MNKFLHFIAAFLFLGISIDASGQDEIQTLTSGLRHSGGYGAILFKSGSFKSKALILTGVRGVWVINRAFGIGLEANCIAPINSYEGMDPNNLEKAYLVGGYGGIFIEPILWSNKVVHITFPVSGGSGWLGYISDWQNDHYDPTRSDLFDDDLFWYLEPGAVIEANVTRFMRLNAGITGRFTQNIELINTNPSEFERMNFIIGLKFGKF
ncbi:MAG TPA: hypothetical protein VI583_07945 [Cyclobacteriaceae bacterium]|nr:hypothetical protein [Cyclobacteriaceae bacterium]